MVSRTVIGSSNDAHAVSSDRARGDIRPLSTRAATDSGSIWATAIPRHQVLRPPEHQHHRAGDQTGLQDHTQGDRGHHTGQIGTQRPEIDRVRAPVQADGEQQRRPEHIGVGAHQCRGVHRQTGEHADGQQARPAEHDAGDHLRQPS